MTRRHLGGPSTAELLDVTGQVPIHPREVGAAYRPGAPRDGSSKQQLSDHSGLGLAGCVPQPPAPVQFST